MKSLPAFLNADAQFFGYRRVVGRLSGLHEVSEDYSVCPVEYAWFTHGSTSSESFWQNKHPLHNYIPSSHYGKEQASGFGEIKAYSQIGE
jgi:hypothetical protein